MTLSPTSLARSAFAPRASSKAPRACGPRDPLLPVPGPAGLGPAELAGPPTMRGDSDLEAFPSEQSHSQASSESFPNRVSAQVARRSSQLAHAVASRFSAITTKISPHISLHRNGRVLSPRSTCDKVDEEVDKDGHLKFLSRLVEGIDDVVGPSTTPYAVLHLDISEAVHLPPSDFFGRADPYVEVYVNDELRCSNREHRVMMSLNPKWNFTALNMAIHSPLSIVRVVVIDWDALNKDDPMGFVEFSVADLVPDGDPVLGWFELRKMSFFEGLAPYRLRKHRRHRDDFRDDVGRGRVAATDIEPRPRSGTQMSTETDATVFRSDHPWSRSSTFKLEAEASGQFMAAPRRMLAKAGMLKRHGRRSGARSDDEGCRGTATTKHYKDPPAEHDPPRKGKREHRDNAGEIHLSLSLRPQLTLPHGAAEKAEERMQQPGSPWTPAVKAGASCDTLASSGDDGGSANLPSLRSIVLTAMFRPSSLYTLCPDPEWFACCFPHPAFVQATAVSQQQMHSTMSTAKEFFDNLLRLKDILYYNLYVPIVSICVHIIYWRTPHLSLGLLMYWWGVCTVPVLWWPSVPVVFAAFIFILRATSLRNALMTHPALLPLNAEGFEILAAQNNSKRVFVWLVRLITDRGGWVSKPAELWLFSRTLLSMSGKPAMPFEQLIEKLRGMDKSLINWHTGLKTKQCKCGSVLDLLGSGVFRVGEGCWSCAGIDSEPCAWNLVEASAHLGYKHYQCPECKLSYCATCSVGGKQRNRLLEVPVERFGILKFEQLLAFVTIYDEAVEDAIELVLTLLGLVARFTEPSKGDLAWPLYACLVFASWGISALARLDSDCWQWAVLVQWMWRFMWVLVGSALILQRSSFIRRAMVAARATKDLRTIRANRRRGGAHRWKFFEPDLDPRSPAVLSSASNVSAGDKTPITLTSFARAIAGRSEESQHDSSGKGKQPKKRGK